MTTASAIFAFGDERPAKAWWSRDAVMASIIMAAFTGYILWTVRWADPLTGCQTMFAMVGVILLAEVLSVGWQKSGLRDLVRFEDPSVRRDVLYGVLAFTGVSAGAVAWILSAIAHTTIGEFIRISWDNVVWAWSWHLIEHVPTTGLRFLVNFMVMDATGTLWHWFQHRNRWAWKIHEYHHSATSFTGFTAYRAHFLEPTVSSIVAALPVALLGADVGQIFIISLFFQLYGFYIHSRIKGNLGWFGRYVIFSAAHHRSHHRKFGVGGNYGSVFTWCDHLLGTYEDPIEDQPELGVENTRHNQMNILMEPFDILPKSKNANN